MKNGPALRIAIVGSLALLFGNVAASSAATSHPTTTRHPTTTVANRPTTTVSKSKKTVPPTRPAGSAAASLIVSGFFSETLSEARLTTPRCHPRGAAANAGFMFNGPNKGYVLTFYLPIGTTSFPSTDPHQYFVSLADLPDESQHWVIGDQKLAPTAGTATFDGAQGTVDLEMLPDPPNPALTPIHVKGILHLRVRTAMIGVAKSELIVRSPTSSRYQACVAALSS